jgi:hypothetical protein
LRRVVTAPKLVIDILGQLVPLHQELAEGSMRHEGGR